MKILAIDIGAGTEDMLLYDSEKNSVENCIKMVLPAPSHAFAAKVRKITKLRRDLFVKGDVIGGGSFSVALKEHVEKGLRVFMTENVAYTVRNNLDEVRELGIEIVTEESESAGFNGEILTLDEVNLRQLQAFLRVRRDPFRR